jgi:predicted permease
MTTLPRSLLVAASCRLHAACLLLLPRRFRARHRVALADTFRDAIEEASQRGTIRLVITATAECADVARQGLSARRDDGRRRRSSPASRQRLALRHAATGRRGSSSGSGCGAAGNTPASIPDTLALDFRAAARSLRRRHSLTVIVALAVGIGATTTVFGVVDGVLLRELPYPDADRLVRVGSVRARSNALGALSPPLLDALQERAQSLTSVAASTGSWVTHAGVGRPQRIRAAWVSGEFFPLLGASAEIGRLLGVADNGAEAPPAAILGRDFWRRQFGGRTDALGESLTLDGRSYTVVGVLGREFVVPEGNRLEGDFDVWLPLARSDLMSEPGLSFLDTVARLAGSTPRSQAMDEVDALGRGLAVELQLHERVFTTLQIAPLRSETIGDVGATLWTLMGAVSLLLLIACANVANLMQTRAAERRHEVNLRAALGAGAARIARLLLIESALLATVGGLVGAALAYLAIGALRAFEPADIPRLAEIAVDVRVLLFTLLTVAFVGVLTGLVPALRARHADPAAAFAAARVASAARGRGLLTHALVTTQTAFALMLVIAAGLLLHSFVRLARVDVGFDDADLIRMQINLGGALDGSDEMQQERIAFFDELRRRVAGIPGVRTAHLTTGAPFSAGGWYSSVGVVGRGEGEAGGAGAEESVYRHQISGGHLSALGLRIVQGREIGDEDRAVSRPVVVINESLARRYWPDGDALGAQVTIGGDGTFTPRTVVGIVSDARYHELEDAPGLHVYMPFEQFPAFAMDVMARFDGNPAAIAESMREAVWSLRGDLAIRDISTMRELVYADLVEPGFYTWLLGSFATVAVLLAGVGIYGSMAHATTMRTREIGIRIAVGAQPAETLRMVLRGALWTTAVGMVLGLVGAWAMTRYLRGFLYDIEATDALAYAAASLVFLLLALVAAYLPARRAASVDPVVALRSP